MISAGFAAAGSRRPGVSFEPAAPTQLSSCLGESWEAVSARKELQIEGVLSVFDQKLAISIFDVFTIILLNINISQMKSSYYLSIQYVDAVEITSLHS